MIELGKKQELTVAWLVDSVLFRVKQKMQGRRKLFFCRKNRFRKKHRRAIRFLYLFTRTHQTV